MPYKIITAPVVEPLTLAEAKAHCRVDGSSEDSIISAMIVAARESAEYETGRALFTQTRELALDAFPSQFNLRGSPIQSIVSVKHLDSAGIEQTVSSSDYVLDNASEPGIVSLAYGKSWPETYDVINAVRVRYVCGYASASDVPAAIKAWMLLAIGAMYAQREAISDRPLSALPDRFWHRLLDPYRIYGDA